MVYFDSRKPNCSWVALKPVSFTDWREDSVFCSILVKGLQLLPEGRTWKSIEFLDFSYEVHYYGNSEMPVAEGLYLCVDKDLIVLEMKWESFIVERNGTVFKDVCLAGEEFNEFKLHNGSTIN